MSLINCEPVRHRYARCFLESDVASGIPEMHERMIAVAALRYGATCITRDTEITGSGLVKVIW